jgi:MFS family permease
MVQNPAIILLAFGQTLVWTCLYYIFPALLLRWETVLGWSKLDLTLAITLAIATSAIFSPIAGKIIDRNYGNSLLLISAVLGGIGLTLLSLIETIWHFYLVWILIGISIAGCLYEPCFAIVTKYRGEKAKHDIITITLIAGFASTICFPLTHIISNIFSWQVATVLFSFVVIFIAAPMLWIGATLIKKEAHQTTLLEKTTQYTKDKFLFKNPVFYYLAICFAIFALVHGVSLNHLLSILSERGYTINTAILAASCIGPMQVVGRLIMLLSEKHLSTYKFSLIALLGMGISMAILFVSGSSVLLLFLFIAIFGTTYGTISVLRPIIVKNLLGSKNFGLKSGYLASAYLSGTAIAPYFGALIWKYFGYQNLILILLILGLLSWIIYIKVNKISHIQDIKKSNT